MAGRVPSPKWRRRLLWLATVALLAAGIAALAIRYPNPGERESEAMSSGPTSVYVRPVGVPLTGARRAAANGVARSFLVHAVLRKDPAAAWGLAAPVLRQGMTRAEWRTGNIPVVPYSADALLVAKWRLWYSYRARIGFEVGLFPKPRTAERPTAFTLELALFGTGPRRHWLVSSWAPVPSLNPPPPHADSSILSRSAQQARKLGAYWLIVPFVLVALALLVPVGIGFRERSRGARAMRSYSKSSAPSRPDVPKRK